MWRYSYNLRALYQTPALADRTEAASLSRDRASAIIRHARERGHFLLNEFESKQLLATYGIPTVETQIAKAEAEAVKQASEIGYPIVLKLFSDTITHKTDVGGVKLNLKDEAAVRAAFQEIKSSVTQKAGAEHFAGVTVQPMAGMDGYELILGSSVDAQFGPVILFGSGGQLVEVYGDRALALPPLNTTLAQRMMEQTRIFAALKGVRGRKPVNMVELEKLLVRFSQLVVEQPWISEIDINPLLASSDRLLALDARVVLHGSEMTEDRLPKPAIRPYPMQYVWDDALKDGTKLTIRPIRPEDEPLMVQFHQTLSERSVYYRYFTSLRLEQRIAHERLARLCFIDYDREMALVVAREDEKIGRHEILGVGRLSKLHSSNEAEFALTVGDQWQNQGLGTQLLKLLIQVGRDEHLERITATILPDNREMQHVCRKAGFQIRHAAGENECTAEKVL
jgi:acetyltransferase